MNRRTAIGSMGTITTHALFPSILTGFVASCTENAQNSQAQSVHYKPTFFTEEEFKEIKVMIDLILPETKTASASSVNTHHFLDEVFARCMTGQQKALIKEGLSKFIMNFQNSTNKNDLVVEFDKNAYADDPQYRWFKFIKQFTLIGFFTSKEGITKASNYLPVPGNYIGEIPLDGTTLNYGLTKQIYYI